MVNVRQAKVEVRSVDLSKRILEQAQLLDYTALMKRFGSMAEVGKVTLGWIEGRALPKRLDEWCTYMVINTEDGDVFLYQCHMEVKTKGVHKQLYI